MAKIKLVSLPNKTFSVVLLSLASQKIKAKYKVNSKEKAYYSIRSSE